MRYPWWRGVKVVKHPNDLILYHQVIWGNRPDFIVECGTAYGGSSVFLGDMLELTGKGKVISIDTDAKSMPEHPRVIYLRGSSVSSEIVGIVRGIVLGKVMVILDSDHSREHVQKELNIYSDIVSVNQFMVVEDAYRKGRVDGPGQALESFLKTDKGARFRLENVDSQFKSGVTVGGWLRRRQ